MKVIITGATGMVGEGVLLCCLLRTDITEVLSVSRKPCGINHPKLKEYLVPDFLNLKMADSQLAGYDGCFFCAGISSIGMDEEKYTKITYDTTLHFAKVLLHQNPSMVFDYVSGTHTDSSEKGKMMWARVKGKTENDLMALGFRGQYNFRPGAIKPVEGQKQVRWFFRPMIALASLFMPAKVLSLKEIATAMINTVSKGFEKQVLEIEDIKVLAKR